MTMQTDYLATMAAQMKQWDANVDLLAAEGEKATAQARTAYQEQIKALRAGREAAQKTFDQVRAASDAATQQMQAGMTVAWDNLQKSLASATTTLRK